MAEERAMDKGASAALKNQDLTEGIYEDAKTDAARFRASQQSSTSNSSAAFKAGAASGTNSVSGQSEATDDSTGSDFHNAVQRAADRVLGTR